MTPSIHRFVRSLPPPIAAADPLSSARERIRAGGARVAPVVAGDRIVGLVRAAELELAAQAGAVSVGSLGRGVPRVPESASRGEAIEAMLARDTTAALVTTEDATPIGWVALADLVRDLRAAHHAAEPPASPSGFDETPE